MKKSWFVFVFLMAAIANAAGTNTVNGLQLLDVNTGIANPALNPFLTGITINPADSTLRNVVIKPVVGAVTRSVVWLVDGKPYSTSNLNPVYFCPSQNCSIYTSGNHTVSAVPYSDVNGKGIAGPVYKVTFAAKKAEEPGCANSRGMWVWTTSDLLGDTTQQTQLISKSLAAGVSNVYLSLGTTQYSVYRAQIQQLVAKLSTAGIKAWGLDGWRGYFRDAYGPANFYAAVDALIVYNTTAPTNSKFYGFEADLEPNDGQGAEFKNTFHNEYPDSQLSTTGGGVWYATQALDRDYLMQDWIAIYSVASNKLHTANLKFSSAMPSWVADFYGESTHVTYKGIRQAVMPIMFGLLDEYHVMSYSTNPSNVQIRMQPVLAYADTLPVNVRPKVFAGLDTFPGGGANSSYADTPGKNSKTAVLTDIATIDSLLGKSASYCGTNIHDWTGWVGLAP